MDMGWTILAVAIGVLGSLAGVLLGAVIVWRVTGHEEPLLPKRDVEIKQERTE